MKPVLKIAGGLFAALVLALFAAFMWFWGRPVGLTNYVNKESLRLATNSPEALTSIGAIDGTILDRHSGKLADYTRATEERLLKQVRDAREGMNRYGPEGLEGEDALTWKVVDFLYSSNLGAMERAHNGYPISQLSGPHINLPSFLTDQHRVDSERSAERYVSRLNAFGRVLRETRDRVEEARAAGVVAPDFIVEKTITGLESFIEGGADANILVTDFERRLGEVEGLSESRRAELLDAARTAVRDEVLPGYEALIAQQRDLLTQTNSDAGIWRIPDGEQIYRESVRSSTSTDYTPDDLHRIGLREVDRIESEMDAILRGQGLTDGTVAERVRILMEDPAQQFPNTDEGREEMLAYLVDLNTEIMARAPEVFATVPAAELDIRRVPEFSQDSAPGGYYNQPAMDGSRPGVFYINLKDTADNPKWTLPTLLVHEAAPGHHFQIARGMELKGVPMLRKFSPFQAYTEGWALYVERMAAEDLDLYHDDPLADLGRLQAEQFRAVRLVVDTGLHAKRWTREEAIDYMVGKTGMTEEEVTREIERYVVWPGQALAYKTGQLAILDMRDHAERELGESFDLKAFHEKLLEHGALPLEVLREQVELWVEERKAA